MTAEETMAMKRDYGECVFASNPHVPVGSARVGPLLRGDYLSFNESLKTV